MDDVKKIAYFLAAAGGVMSEKGFHLLYEKDNELVEELWDTTVVRSKDSVGEDVKTNAPAAYIWAATDDADAQDKRLVFSVNQEDKLTYFTYNNDTEEWEDADLGDADGIKVHPQSALAADVGPDGLNVFFVNTKGKIQSIVMRDDAWELGDVLDANPRVGTPLSTASTEKGLLLYYIGTDNVLHIQSRNHESGKWEDNSVDSIRMEAPVSRFKVSRDSNTNTYEAYFLSEGKLIRFAGGNDKVEVGTINGRELIKNNAAQNMYRTFMTGIVTRNGSACGYRVSQRTTYTYKDGGSRTSYSSRTYPL